MNVSIIVPAYNEENGIAKEIEEIKKVTASHNGNCEIIVVNDGSTDMTGEIAMHSQIKLIEHPVNKGYGAALKSGIKKAANDIIVITDADGTYPNEKMLELVKEMKDYDMVVGARTGKHINISPVRKIAKWIISKLANYLSGTKIIDLNSGLRVMRKRIVKKFLPILPDGFSFTTTITLAMLSNGYLIKYVPIDYQKRTGKSKIKPIRDTLNFIQLIIRTIIYFNPLKVFISVSLVLFFLGITVLFFSTFFTAQIMYVATITIFIAALQMLAIGMIADLIIKKTNEMR